MRSFIPVTPECHFPIQNLPWGTFTREGETSRIGIAIGESIVDLRELAKAGLLPPLFADAADLGPLLATGRSLQSQTRQTLQHLLRDDVATLRDDRPLRDRAILPRSGVRMLLPCRIPNYTDFYSSKEHATNVGIMLRGAENALMPNWVHVPIAYHGRASSIVVSGTDFPRPLGQTKADNAEAPTFGPSKNLDFELEMGTIITGGNPLGCPVPIGQANEQIFGLLLVNDWSARDIQKWEYQPLGPFLAKNFLTSISPWVVPLDALEAFRIAGPKQDPEPLPYLRTTGNWNFDIHLEVLLNGQRICSSNSKHLYWNVCQQIAHHASNGCNLMPGDLLATGTISGPTPDSFGSMLELTWRGTKPMTLADGSTRRFLEDGDVVTMTGWCQGDGYRIGFGEVTGRVLPAGSAVAHPKENSEQTRQNQGK